MILESSRFGSFCADSAKMREAETGLIFQPITDRAIHADMGQPDDGERHHQGLTEGEAERRERGRQDGGVCRVVDDRAGSGAGQIGRQADVGKEEEQDKNPPGAAPERVNQHHAGEQGQPLQPQQDPDGAGDRAYGYGGFTHLSIPRFAAAGLQKATQGGFWFAERPCIAFSSEVDTGSREENASKTKEQGSRSDGSLEAEK